MYEEDDQSARDQFCLPQHTFSASTKPVQAMTSVDDNLIIGGRNNILGYSWDHILKAQSGDKNLTPTWTVDLHLPT